MPADTSLPRFKTSKVTWMDLREGLRIVRILTPVAYKYITHYIKGIAFQCLGDECPICATNKRIIFENPNPEVFRKIPGYAPIRVRNAVNVLDRTPCKTCPNCGTDVYKRDGNYPSKCTNCECLIGEVVEAPSNKIKIILQGPGLFDQLNNIETMTVGPDGNPLGWLKYDVKILTTGADLDTKRTVIPGDISDDIAPLLEGKTEFVLSSLVLMLTTEEINQVVAGVALKDIFASRNVAEAPVSAEVTKAVSTLFNQ